MNNVFISYSHDSQEHCDRILALSNQLMADGLNCFLDQYESSPPEGWPKWMNSQLMNADKVILIITETYFRRVMDKEIPGKSLGVKWESTLTYQYIYDDDSKNNRFIPTIFKPEDAKYIPPILKGSTFYCLNDAKGYEDLYRRLTDQPLVKKPKPGKIKILPTKETPSLFPTKVYQNAAGLTDAGKAAMLNWAAFGLRAVGRLEEAIEPFRAGLEDRIKQENWEDAARRASNLSQMTLTLGRIADAVSYGRQGVRYADQSGDDFLKEVLTAILADALHQSGEFEEAKTLFREAEAIQKKRQPECPFLNSLQGFQFCDLLLSQGPIMAAIERANFALIIAKINNWLLDISLNQLILGRACMARALEMQDAEDVAKADRYFNQAMDGLRKAGDQIYLPRGLLARAAFYRIQKMFPNAWDDLNEAREIAELGSMKLHLADYHLEAGRYCRDEGKNDEAAGHFTTAKTMIDQMGYHRRDAELK
ncbi:MAG: SEFIR domain-containing protein [Candidatus Omnitrophota bacterium]